MQLTRHPLHSWHLPHLCELHVANGMPLDAITEALHAFPSLQSLRVRDGTPHGKCNMQAFEVEVRVADQRGMDTKTSVPCSAASRGSH